MGSKTGFVYHPEYLQHVLSYDHPESPSRLHAIQEKIKATGLDKALKNIEIFDDKQLVDTAINRIHSRDHIKSVLSCAQTGDIAHLASAGVLGAVKAVMSGELANAFCAIRPPGHHAHNNGAHNDGNCQGQGFCFFNNVAIAARYAQDHCGCRKILIVDWDFHHGNGTEWAFYNDPTVFFFSTHALFAYPGTGFPDRKGNKEGYGYNLNVPLEPYADDTDILKAWKTRLLPKLRELKFEPDLVLVSAGFDSREEDYIGNFSVTDKGFVALTRLVMDIAHTYCDDKLVAVMEGGYNPAGLALAVTAHLKTLVDYAGNQLSENNEP